MRAGGSGRGLTLGAVHSRRVPAPRAVLAAALTAAALPAGAAAGEPPQYVFPLSCADVRYSDSHHDYPATDMFAPVGCPFVAPVDGVVDEVSRKDRWDSRTNRPAERGGLFVSIVGVDGVRYYGSHLSAVSADIRPGATVRAGQRLGLVGRTGNARYTPAHLHFGISRPTGPGNWQVRRGEIWPAPYLDAWREGRDKSPAAEVEALDKAPRPTPTR